MGQLDEAIIENWKLEEVTVGNRGAWRVTVHRAAKESDMTERLNNGQMQ